VKKVPTNVNYPHAQKSDFFDACVQDPQTKGSQKPKGDFSKNTAFSE
jgi:hypothetical protein